jgi:hypothetical protein
MTARTLEEAVEESHAALGATGSGDIEPFMALYSDGDDITFGNPFEPFVGGKEAAPRRPAGVRRRGRAFAGEGRRQRQSSLDRPPSDQRLSRGEWDLETCAPARRSNHDASGRGVSHRRLANKHGVRAANRGHDAQC